ncbi:MAG: 2-(1,2-epoxy-1,2-dihydrophenyl)acetyl-CoA isomerase [Ignavibacteria bacterium GWB2_35_6b]|nr:MAG: 2-(1,2-epoxy-1,2-dihydrophenyl)acetyl-CoA isomerase [Ignavibacteria bacterium GWB2_35_6b]
MNEYKFISFYKDENIAIIKLNRPDVLNSFNKPMGSELKQALLYCSDDSNIRAVLLTGEGKGFCAGQDLEEAVPKGDQPLTDLGELIRENYNPIIKLIRSIEKPIVCAVNGVAAGAGANIALACDIVVASDKASFIQAFSKIGVVPDSGGTYYLPRLVGFSRATSLMMLAEKVTAEEAQNIGMIYKVFSHEKFLEESLSIAKHLSTQPTKALGYIKRLLNKSFENNLDEQLKLEEELQTLAGKTSDYKEGVKSFQEKREPNFRGE